MSMKTYTLADVRKAIQLSVKHGTSARVVDITGTTLCSYNGDGENCHCIVGWMLADDPHAQNIIAEQELNEGNGIHSLMHHYTFGINFGLAGISDVTLLINLQAVHDNGTKLSPESLLKEYNNVLVTGFDLEPVKALEG